MKGGKVQKHDESFTPTVSSFQVCHEILTLKLYVHILIRFLLMTCVLCDCWKNTKANRKNPENVVSKLLDDHTECDTLQFLRSIAEQSGQIYKSDKYIANSPVVPRFVDLLYIFYMWKILLVLTMRLITLLLMSLSFRFDFSVGPMRFSFLS